MNRTGKILLGVLALGIGALLWSWQNAGPTPLAPGDAALRHDGPVAEDGYPDYAAKIDALYRRELLPEQNAAVALLELLGASVLGEQDAAARSEICTTLGLDAPPAGTAPWVDAFTWREKEAVGSGESTEEAAAAFSETLDKLHRGAWAPGEDAIRDRFMARSEATLDGLVAAATRPRLWLPLIESSESGALVTADLNFGVLLDAARMLAARATRRDPAVAPEAQCDRALADVEALWRLAALQEQLPGYLPRFIAEAFARFALETSETLLRSEGLGNAHLERLEVAAAPLSDVPSMASTIDQVERSLMMDTVLRVTGFRPLLDPKASERMPKEAVDSALLLNGLNTLFDEAVVRARREPPAEAAAALDALRDQYLDEGRDQAEQVKSLWGRIRLHFFTLPGTRRELGSRFLVRSFGGLSLGPAGSACRTRATHEADRRLMRLAIAAVRYRREHQAWPQALEQIAEGVEARNPATGLPLQFRVDAEGLRLAKDDEDPESQLSRAIVLR